MQVIIQTFDECLAVVNCSRERLYQETSRLGHDRDSCGCNVCRAYRQLSEVAELLFQEWQSRTRIKRAERRM